MHRVQRVVAAVLGPLEEGADRALKPARDLVNWFDETFEARGENENLKEELADARDQLAQAQTASGERQELEKLAELTGGGLVPAGNEAVTARVIGRSPTVWYSTVTIDKGSSAGIRVDDAVVAARRPGRPDHRDHRGDRQGHPDHRRESSVTGRVLARRLDRRGRSRTGRRPARPAAQLRPARRARSRRTRGSSRPASPAAPRIRCSRRGSRSAKVTESIARGAAGLPAGAPAGVRGPAGHGVRPGAGTGWRMILTPDHRRAAGGARGLATALLQVAFFAKIDLFGTSPDGAALVVMTLGLLGGSVTGAVPASRSGCSSTACSSRPWARSPPR